MNSHSQVLSQKITLVVFIFVLVIGAFPWTPIPAGQAATHAITVNSAEDNLKNNGACTLREAIIAANKDAPSGSKSGECAAGNGADIILIPAFVGTITLSRTDNGKEDASATGDLDILDDLTIQVSGPGVLIQGANDFSDRIFHILRGTVTLNGFSVRGGLLPESGGGIYNLGDLTLEGVTLSGNQAGNQGGAIYNALGASLTIVNSTISGNGAGQNGGGFYNAGTAQLNNVTITANLADQDGDGTGSGGGLANPSGILNSANSVIGGNSDSGAAPDCLGAIESRGYNLVGNPAGCVIEGDSALDLTGLDPVLSPLEDHGGGTPTHTPLEGSPLIDAGNPVPPGSSVSACKTEDQHGALRPHGAACDIGAVEAGQPNASVLIRAIPNGDTTQVVGRLFSAPDQTFSLQFYAAASCDAALAEPGNAAGAPIAVTTDASGEVLFTESISTIIPIGSFLTAIAADLDGNASPPSRCVRVGPGNDSWPTAYRLTPGNSPHLKASSSDFIDLPGVSRWYKFKVEPNSRLIVTLTDLPDNYDLTLYKDIPSAYQTLSSPEDLTRLDAEFAPDAFSPDAYSPDAFSPDAYSPDAYSPDAFSPDAFSPDAYSPDAYSPDAFSPDAYSPDAFSPDAYSPDAYSPDAFSPDAYSPDAYSPDAFSPDAYSSAQTRSLIAISAFEGLVSEGIVVNTWDQNSDMYVRVRGRNGAYSSSAPFNLQVHLIPGSCGDVDIDFPASTLTAEAGDYRTLILTDLPRTPGDQDEKETLLSRLEEFAARQEVAGVIIDLSQDQRVLAANAQADAHPACPYAKNLLAATIKEVIMGYWDLNPDLQYLTLIGGDQVIPFFRHPDHSLLANEKNYAPPVRDNTPSQASLKLGYVLSQDNYGARQAISLKDDDAFPIPDLAVGRLVESAAEAATVLDAYLSTQAGVVASPSSALVTGYDFLADAATATMNELLTGIGGQNSAVVEGLITDASIAPQLVCQPGAAFNGQCSWTADDLRAALLTERHDLVFLAGHFSASSALAADYSSRVLAEEVADSTVDMSNAIYFSAGCHTGYNTVDDHGVPLVTRQPDWAQAFARKGATLLAGTGYQYGDTDFLKYSEKVYLEFSRQLRTGTGPVSVGTALVNAKRVYLAETPYLRGIDEKAVLEATLFGLPMLSVDMPGERLPITGSESLVSETSSFSSNPGASLGLSYADLSLSPTLTLESKQLTNVQAVSESITASYYSGPDGTIVSPNEPVLPLASYPVGLAEKALRGVGFRGGSHTDLYDIYPLTGAAATEIRGVHTPFLSNIFYPVQTWGVNYFPALSQNATALTRLNLYPVQYRSSQPGSLTGRLRRFELVDLRLYYSDHIASSTSSGVESTPALAAPPSIYQVKSNVSAGQVEFEVRVAGNPAAGIQEVWVTYSLNANSASGVWESLDLDQNPLDSTLWQGSLSLGETPPPNVRFIVQAANGVGLVSMDSNQGRTYTPGGQAEPELSSTLAFIPGQGQNDIPSSGRYSEQVAFSAQLSAENGDPLTGKPILFSLGPQSRLTFTGPDGIASATLSIYALTGSSQVQVSFAGDQVYQASFSSQPFDIFKQVTQISLEPQPAEGYPEDDPLLTTILSDANDRRLSEETIFFIISGDEGTHYQPVITDYAGRAPLGAVPLPPGEYTVDVYFSGTIPLPEVLTLEDDRYLPAIYTGGELTLINKNPTAVEDSYQVDEDGVLSVPAPGVLANDHDPEGAPLTALLAAPPAFGELELATDGSFIYHPSPDYFGTDRFRYQASDGEVLSQPTLVNITVEPVNDPPVCSAAVPNPDSLWPPDNSFQRVEILNLSDPDSGTINLSITGVFQDEPVGAEPDAIILGDAVELRAERDGNGDGRVYHIFFDAVDDQGGACSGEVVVAVVPHDQSGDTQPIDGGALYDSTRP